VGTLSNTLFDLDFVIRVTYPQQVPMLVGQKIRRVGGPGSQDFFFHSKKKV
jgi:hypothetical protein